jgi:hypothetical protein
MNFATDPWYEDRRGKVMKAISLGKPLKGRKEKRNSPMGKYTLELVPYSVSDNRFPFYSVVEIIRTSDGDRIGKVIRNDADFPFIFVEDIDGKDYLLCAEDNQGFTVINISEGKKHDYIAEKSKRGLAMRITDFYLSPDRKNLAIEGYVKNKPNDVVETDEIHFYRVEDFMKVPYAEVDKRITFAYDKVIGWESNERILISQIEDFIVPTGVCLDDIKDTEERIELLRKGNIKKQTAYYSYCPNSGEMHKVFSEWR